MVIQLIIGYMVCFAAFETIYKREPTNKEMSILLCGDRRKFPKVHAYVKNNLPSSNR